MRVPRFISVCCRAHERDRQENNKLATSQVADSLATSQVADSLATSRTADSLATSQVADSPDHQTKTKLSYAAPLQLL